MRVVSNWWIAVLCLTFRGLSALSEGNIHSIKIGQNAKFLWLLDYENRMVKVEVHVNTIESSDWFAVGFSDYGALAPSDLCIYWVHWKGKPRFQDAWVDKNGKISVDVKQDCRDFRVKHSQDQLKFYFTRKFDTCDDADYVIQDGTTHVVWAHGSGPLWSLDGVDIKSAFASGTERTTLLANDHPLPMHPPETWKLEITNRNVTIPSQETTYWCFVQELPKTLNQKQHVIQYEPVFDLVGLNFVHHMEVFHCDTDVNAVIPPYNGECEKKPEGTKVCSRVVAAWAMGAPPFVYPKEAGLSIGGPKYNKFVMLEVHYNNPDQKAGETDKSGFRLFITPSLRKYDAAVMELGLEYNDKQVIPPEQESFYHTGFCISECTGVGIPHSGITVFASQLHTHLTGVKVFTKHVRNGVELPELNRDNHYTQHFQEIRRLKRPVQILPGDALITFCEYRTLNKSDITLTGFSISDEMCINYIHYYPRVNLEVCKSSIPDQNLQNFFQNLAVSENQDTAGDKGISTKYEAIEWTPKRVQELKDFYSTSPISMQCNQSSGARFPGYWEGLPQTEIMLPLPVKERRCGRRHYFT